MAKRIAVLTGGGCASGLDPFLEAFVKGLLKCRDSEFEILGIRYGWDGLLGDEPVFKLLSLDEVEGLVRSAGTYLGTSRENPAETPEKLQKALENLGKMQVEGLVTAGGDDTLAVAHEFHKKGVKVLGVPKTMDWDLSGTEDSVGFMSYCEAVFSTAVPGFINILKAHRRVGVLELFGRKSGFTTAMVGLTSGACFIALPEVKLNLAQMLERVREFYAKNDWAMVAMGEAVELEIGLIAEKDEYNNEFLFQKHAGESLVKLIKSGTGFDARSFQAIHPFRGMASAHDAMLGFRLGDMAAEMVRDNYWGVMLSVDNLIDPIRLMPLSAFKPRRVMESGPWLSLVERRNKGEI